MYACHYSPSYPLYRPDGNELDPCFIKDVGKYIFISFCLLVGCDLYDIFRSKEHTKIQYSFGSFWSSFSQKLRLASIFTYAVLQFTLLVYTRPNNEIVGFLLQAIAPLAVLALAFTLHLIEPTRSIVQRLSLLWFWTFQVIYNTTCLAQDILSPMVKIWGLKTPIELKIAIWFVSVTIFVLEACFWYPTEELKEYFQLNEWDIDSFHNSFVNITFSWLHPLLADVYYTDKIDVKKIPKSPSNMKVDLTLSKFMYQWDNEVSRAKKKQWKLYGNDHIDEDDVSLLSCIVYAFWPLILGSFGCDAVSTILTFASPFLQKEFILFFTYTLRAGDGSHSAPPLIRGYFIALMFFVVSLTKTVLSTQTGQLKAQARYSGFSINSFIYQKALKLSSESRHHKNIGQIMNHISLDVPIITSFPMGSAVKIIIAPFKVILCVLSLYKIIGNAVWGGVITAMIMIPLVSKIKSITTPLNKKIMEYKDSRLQLLNEVLTSMLSIKLYTWEDLMQSRIENIRNDQELKSIRKLNIWSAFSKFIFSTVPFCILCSSFVLFVILYKDTPLSPDIVFPALSLFGVLGGFISQTSGLIQRFAKAKIAYNRMEEYLLLEEKSDENGITRSYGYSDLENVIDACHATFVWNQPDQIALKDINYSAKKGQLSCIVGKVGSGKTTLIKGLLGEIPMLPGGRINIHGSIAYCSQNSWIINGSVKDNIVFGFPFDKLLYDKTIKVCELLTDLNSFPLGDQTLVGEKGISLSGGQRARISLARAIYSNSDIYIFDDILSAVDRYVGQRIIQNVLGNEGILKSKTRVMTTNFIPMIHLADEVVLLEGGCIVERQRGSEILGTGDKLEKLITEYGGDLEAASLEVDQPVENILSVKDNTTTSTSPTTVSSEDESPIPESKQEADITIANEKSSIGGIRFSVYYEYFQACNYMTIFIYAGFTALSIFISVYQTTLLSEWSDYNLEMGKTMNPAYYLTVYAMCVIFRGIFTMSSLIILWVFSFIKGSTYFHNQMVHNILRSPMELFETTPVGTILNRFSSDVASMDLTIPGIFVTAANLIINSLTSFIIIIWQLPTMGIVILSLLIVYDTIRRYYIPASREFNRLARTTNSPILSNILESINGIDTLNAYGQINRYIKLNEEKIENHITVNYTSASLSRWLSIRLQTISLTILLCTCICCLVSLRGPRPFDAALVGFILNYALSIPLLLRSIITNWTQVETQTVAIERILDYCQLPLEAERFTPSTQNLPLNWPSQGSVRFFDYSTRYRENLPIILKRINFRISNGEKIGIIGRTGSGKSTISKAIFRLIEGIDDGGYIEIDGRVTKNVGLYDLRHNLSIIPQNCQTIEGTVRENLDPFNEHTDDDIWKALEMSHLKHHVMNLSQEPPKKNKKKERFQKARCTGCCRRRGECWPSSWPSSTNI